jgi:hypothetical protein
MATDGLTGVTEMDSSAAFVTVNIAEPVLPPKLALMVDVPAATPIARPVVLLTVATVVIADTQADEVDTLREVPSEKVAVATNCWVPLVGIVAVAGVTASATRSAAGKPKIASRPWSPPPHAAINAVISNAKNHKIGFA